MFDSMSWGPPFLAGNRVLAFDMMLEPRSEWREGVIMINVLKFPSGNSPRNALEFSFSKVCRGLTFACNYVGMGYKSNNPPSNST